ncbi:MAG: hypothetical protein HY847_16965 [Betaproteobacteria bacterium]|nr:hypothetical protein [Betaproteobacteria bacterium]
MNRALNLLLVEENDVDGKIIKVALSKAGIQGNLFTVRSGWECLRFLRKQDDYVSAPSPDVIIVDLNFLREGTAQLDDLKAYTDTAGIPVIVLADEYVEKKILAPYLSGTLRSLRLQSGIDDFISSIRKVIFDLLPDIVGSHAD